MPLLDPIPSPVLNADFAALEWEPLLVLVAGFAASPVGRDAILSLRPSIDEEWIARQHQLTGEVRLLLQEQVSIALGGLFDPTQHAAKAQISGAALEADELQAVARLANDVASWQSLLQSPPARLVGKVPGLSSLSSALTGSLRPLAESIERTIQPDGSLADNASPELGRIRREQERQQRVNRGEPARGLAQALRRRGHPGRPHHDSRRALRDSRPRRVEASHQRRGSRRQLLGADGLRRASGNHRAEQRTGSADRRRAGRNSPHLCCADAPGRRLCSEFGCRRACSCARR